MASCGGRVSSGIVFRACRRRGPLFIQINPISISSSTSTSTSSSSEKLTEKISILSSLLRRRFHQRCVCVGFSSRSFCTPSTTNEPPPQQLKTKKPVDRIVRVTQAPKQQTPTTTATGPGDQSSSTRDFSFLKESKLIGAAKAKSEYCLTDEHLKTLMSIERRSPIIGEPKCKMYYRSEVLEKALAVYGTVEALEVARVRAKTLEFVSELDSNGRVTPSSDSPLWPLRPWKHQAKSSGGGVKRKGIASAAWRSHGTERVVLAALAVNAGSLVVKLAAWWWTGSHSLMAESLHSLADTINQLLVAYGVHESLRKPDKMHPYGYSNVRHVTSLVSGIGIFYIGSAMSVYHGIRGLWAVAPLESLHIGLLILGVAFCGDGLTFLMAQRTVKAKAAASGVTAKQYVRAGEDPSLSVVYLEDRAALYGVGIAIASLSLSFIYSSPIPDAVGSICIGLVLFQVAYKIIVMNVDQLLGKSIPLKEIDQITQQLEADPVVRSIQDIKATELGAGEIRFKAEIDFDGRHITRAYLKTIDLEKALEEAQSLKTPEDLEQFLMKHGESITDRQGAEIDRIEQALKKKFPDLRHVDLEAL